jgi:hypothetical protein
MKDNRNLISILVSGILFLLLLQETQSFTTKPISFGPKFKTSAAPFAKFTSRGQWVPLPQDAVKPRLFKSRLSMYGLPPGGGGSKNELGDIAKGVAGLVLVVAFFASPVGGFILGIFNSFFLLLLLLPVIGTIVFQSYEYFYTLDGPCPNCASPAKVIKTTKEGESTPTICYNCGAILQANYDNTGIDNITGKNSVTDDVDYATTLASVFDMFGGGSATTGTTRPAVTPTTTVVEEEKKSETKNRSRREGTIIDVEIEDDKPFQ